MTTIVRPVALCVLLLVGVTPAATVACELACAAPAGHPGHDANAQESHHDHSSASVAESTASPDAAFIVSLAADCDHDVSAAPALTASALKVLAPVAIASATVAAPAYRASGVTLRDADGGPPGTRFGPLPLRI